MGRNTLANKTLSQAPPKATGKELFSRSMTKDLIEVSRDLAFFFSLLENEERISPVIRPLTSVL